MKKSCRIQNPFPLSPNRGLTAVDVPGEYMAPSIPLGIGTPVPVDTRDTSNQQLVSDEPGPSYGDNAPDVHFDTKGPEVDTHAPRTQSIRSTRGGTVSPVAEKCKTDLVSCTRGPVLVLRAVQYHVPSQAGPPIGGEPSSQTLSEKAGVSVGNKIDTGN